jgi:hypothetical protein
MPIEATTTSIAVLSQALDAHWRAPGEGHAVGEALAPGWLHLQSGILRVEFYNGVNMVVEGPADIRLVTVGMAQLDAGRISADVPTVARGFSVLTPHLTAVDLGTAFGILVDGHHEEVHVFTGHVTLKSTSGPAHEIHAGEAMQVIGASEPESIPFHPTEFKSAADVDMHTGAVQDRRLQDWRKVVAHLDVDLTLLVRFGFATTTIAGRTMRNLAVHGAEAGDGTLIGCAPSGGRWPGTQSLEFRSQSDRVRLGVPGVHHHVTLMTWVRVDALEHPFNSLFMTDGFAEGALHWQIRGNGSLHCSLSGPSGQPAEKYNFDSPDIFTAERLAKWVQLVVTYDGPGHLLSQYVDGRPVGQFTLAQDLGVRIGHAELGNWNSGDSPDGAKIRNLTGKMDEFSLFTRTFDKTEIQALFRASAPYEDRVR